MTYFMLLGNSVTIWKKKMKDAKKPNAVDWVQGVFLIMEDWWGLLQDDN